MQEISVTVSESAELKNDGLAGPSQDGLVQSGWVRAAQEL